MTQDRFVQGNQVVYSWESQDSSVQGGFRTSSLGTLDISALRDVGHEQSLSHVSSLFKGTSNFGQVCSRGHMVGLFMEKHNRCIHGDTQKVCSRGHLTGLFVS